MKRYRIIWESERLDKRAPLFWRMARAAIQDQVRLFKRANRLN